jgi:hypothetical protein
MKDFFKGRSSLQIDLEAHARRVRPDLHATPRSEPVPVKAPPAEPKPEPTPKDPGFSLTPPPAEAEFFLNFDALAVHPGKAVKPEVQKAPAPTPEPAKAPPAPPEPKPEPAPPPSPEETTPMDNQPNPRVGPVIQPDPPERKVSDLDRVYTMLQQALGASAEVDMLALDLRRRLYGESGEYPSRTPDFEGGPMIPRLLMMAELLLMQSLRTHSSLLDINQIA